MQALNSNVSEEWTFTIGGPEARRESRVAALWRHRDLILLFVHRDLVTLYKQTILGPLWYVVQPFLTTVVFSIVFGRVAGISTDGVPAFLFYLVGVTVWSYLAECVTKTSETFIQNATLFGKVYFPRLCVPVAVVLSGLAKFGIQVVFVTGFWLVYRFQGANLSVRPLLLILPFLLVQMAALGLSLGLLVSALTTKYRDLRMLITFGVQLMMYATPVVYPLSTIPAAYRWIAVLNPMTPIVETFRSAVLGAGTVSPAHLAGSLATTLAVLWVSTRLFERTERTFVDTV